MATGHKGVRGLTRRQALAALGSAAGLAAGLPSAGRALGQPRRGGRAIFAVAAAPASLEPHLEGSDLWQRRQPLVYERLVEQAADLTIHGQLAESWETPSPTTVVSRLRRGVKFHNGKELDSGDVKYTLERILDPKVGSPARGDLVMINSVEAVDKYTVRFSLKSPSGTFLAALAGKWKPIIPKDSVKAGDELRRAAVGTGPFRLKEFKPSDTMLFERHPDYWDKGKPSLDELVLQVVPDENSIVAGLRSGTIGAAAFEDTKHALTLARERNVVVLRSPALRWEVLDLMGDLPPTDKREVRQAISLALDREAILQVAGNGIGQPIGFLPGALAPYALPPDQLPFHKRDVAQAKALMARAGYAGGPITLRTIVGYPQLDAAAQIIVANLAEIGIEAKIEVVDIGVWIKDWLARKSPITMNSWGGITDPDLGLYIHFHGQPNGRDFRRLGSPEVDRLLDEGRTERDSARRVKIYHDLRRVLATEAISLPLYSADLVFAHQRYVKGLSLHPTGYFYGLREMWVER